MTYDHHLDLSTPCDVTWTGPRGGGTLANRRLEAKRRLKEMYGVEVKRPLHMNHKCSHGSTNGWCCNPHHIYLGSKTDDCYDKPIMVRRRNGSKKGQVRGIQPNNQAFMEAGKKQGHVLWVSWWDGFECNAGNMKQHNRKLGLPNWRVRVE